MEDNRRISKGPSQMSHSLRIIIRAAQVSTSLIHQVIPGASVRFKIPPPHLSSIFPKPAFPFPRILKAAYHNSPSPAVPQPSHTTNTDFDNRLYCNAPFFHRLKYSRLFPRIFLFRSFDTSRGSPAESSVDQLRFSLDKNRRARALYQHGPWSGGFISKFPRGSIIFSEMYLGHSCHLL